jgi:anti-anti-sigma factor
MEPQTGDPRTAPRTVTIRVTGEIDIATAPELDALLHNGFGPDGTQTDFTVDLSDVTFLALRGYSSLLGAAREAQRRGTAFRVTGHNPDLARISAALGAQEPLAASW